MKQIITTKCTKTAICQLMAYRPLEIGKERERERITGWTNVNLLHFSDTTEIASLKGLTLCYPEINQSKRPLGW